MEEGEELEGAEEFEECKELEGGEEFWRQCSRSMTFWVDPDPDPRIHASD